MRDSFRLASVHSGWDTRVVRLLLRFVQLLLVSILSFSIACAEPPTTSGFFPGKLTEIEAAIRLAIADGRLPGGVVWLERKGETYHRAFGDRAVRPERVPNTEDTIYDAASLTKVIATTTAVMRLIEAGKIELNAPVSKYLPHFSGEQKDAVTVRHLLTPT